MYCTLTPIALVDMRKRLGVTTEEMTRVMALKNIGGLVSGLLVGSVLDRFREHTNLILAVSLVVCGTGTMTQPWSTYLEVLGVLFFIEGLCQGASDTGA